MIKNKKILLGCKEFFSFPMYFLGQELKKNNNDVHYYFLHASDVTEKNQNTKNIFFYFQNNIKKQNIHDVRDICLKMNDSKKKIDEKRLKEIEKKYTHFNSLNEQLISSQHTSAPFHDRFYYKDTNYEENLYWLMLNYNKTESILDLVKPDYIFDLDTQEIQRTIINEIANNKGIPYISFEHSRYESIYLPTFNLGKQIDTYLLEAYNKNRNDIFLEKYIKKVEDYRLKPEIMAKSYLGTRTTSYSFGFNEMIKTILTKTYKSIISNIYIIFNNKNWINFNFPIYSARPIKRYIYKILSPIKKYFLYSSFNRYFLTPSEENYVYYPLHFIPESSTFVKSPHYINDMSVIEAISKSLPINWKVYVKEHQAMIGERNFKFYKNLSRLHNVKLVKPNYYKDPKPWIEKSLAVVTITGSSAFEATMLNKPAIVFGSSSFNLLSGVKVAKSFDGLRSLFKLIETKNWSNDNTMDCAAYLKTINDVGINLNMVSLQKICQKKIVLKSIEPKEEEDLKNLLNRLIFFFEKAIDIHFKIKKKGIKE